MSDDSQRKHLSKIKLSNITYPILIGLGVVGYMVYQDFDREALSVLTFSFHTVVWIIIALLFMVGRDVGYIIRIKILSGREMSWYEAFRVIMLWEFTSAITPSAVGGTSFAIKYFHKAGISVGRSSAIVLLTSFFDELFFIVMFPLLVIIVGGEALFSAQGVDGGFFGGVLALVLTGYFLKLTYLLFVTYGLFFNPKGLKWLMIKIFSFKPLRRWREAAARAGDDLIVSAIEIRKHRWGYWVKLLAATFVSWSSRYLVVNALIMAFIPFNNHVLLFARQLVMWVMMLVMPTPGGSGFSEYFFAEYLGDFIPIAGLAILLSLFWRMITYYLYLFIGIFVFPRWLKEKFGK
ncbi:MAG: lysylphosphatidylglycerol synthase transmembrane domain-containing protein [Rikenellaceae bacterium]